MATSSFCAAVEHGLALSRRLYYGKGAPPAPAPPMSKSPDDYLPRAVTAYAAVDDPSAVDNPDVPSYQPYVHGRCDPPALLPLQMMEVRTEAQCWFDTAFVAVSGLWRLHCLKSGRRCDCKVAVPMGEKGLLLGVEARIDERLYGSQLIAVDDLEGITDADAAKAEDGQFLKFQTFVFRIPEVEGGSTISVKVNWSQKLVYHAHQYLFTIPFSFPSYVNPRNKQKKETIALSVSSGTGAGVFCSNVSHPLKEATHDAGKADFVYEGDVSAWSTKDFSLSYSVSSVHITGGILLQAPPPMAVDQREMFCLYLYPGNNQSRMVFRREVVFVIDISGSMQGELIINAKTAVLECLSKLDSGDSFNVIGFNDEVFPFSSCMKPATKEEIASAGKWVDENFVPGGGTNILLPVELALKLLAETRGSIPLVFLVTDGTVDNERRICQKIKDLHSQDHSTGPRICTLAIGTYCNHYFLKTLAEFSRGEFDAAPDAGSIAHQLPKLFDSASRIILADISVDAFGTLDSVELHPCRVPDLPLDCPLIVSGRYTGKFPEIAKITGTLADKTVHTMDLKARHSKDIPLEKVLARRQIDGLTAQAWFDDSTEARNQVAGMSIQYGVPSEFTYMILLETGPSKQASKSKLKVLDKLSSRKKMMDLKGQKIVFVGSLGKGFGNSIATAKNIPPGMVQKQSDAAEFLVKAASNFCGGIMHRCCCMCFIKTCSCFNDQCAIVLTQLGAALACCECLDCCFDICDCLSSCP